MNHEQVNIQIDGVQTQVPAQLTVLEAARTLGIAIPTLCQHKALSPYGACRVCLVETTERGRTELKTACNTLVQPGMTVLTASERVLRSRKIMVELLLARAPKSQAILDVAAPLGVEASRFPQRDNDCILCGLCVRVCEERMGKSAISFAHRGIKREVVPPFNMQTEVCQTCGACVSVCPTNCVKLETITSQAPRPMTSEFDAGLGSRHPVYIPFPQAVPNYSTIDKDNCIHFKNGKCGVCEAVCEAKAIDFEQTPKQREVNAGAIVLTGGYDLFDAGRKPELGYGRYPNVVTSIQFERILSASGPYQGHLVRPGDGKHPKKIAWLQCVGSRDVTQGNDYCSSVCCMYATKAAIIAKEHEADVEPTIFYIDMRAFGKGFEGFYNRAKDNYGVRYVRSQISSIKENPETQDLILKYVAENGRQLEEEFEMVVLSVGLVTHHSTKATAELAGVECNRFGFVQTQPFQSLLSSKPGVFVCGAISGPKDIPETVQESSAAAALVGELLGAVRGTQVKVKEYPAEREVAGESPRIGVFVCHCGTNIAATVNVATVAEYIKDMPGVVHAEHTIYACSQDTQERMKQIIQDNRLNRVIVASCTPRTHQPLFQETMREAGLNKHLFEMADIREQCSWCHQQERDKATEKAKALVRGSVGKASLLEPLQFKKVGITRAALVLGGGMSGMTSALSLAKQGYEVCLVEKSGELGGNLRHIRQSLEGYAWPPYLEDTIKKVMAHPAIDVNLRSEIDEVSGFVGNFKTKLKGASAKEVKHGVIILATGAGEFEPNDFLYGKNQNVITQRELEAKLGNGFAPQSVVMIQCVGSRDAEHPWCSRVCCGEAVKNALAIKKKNPAAKVYVLYRDIRTYQFKELYYRQARDLGVAFIHFPDDQYPRVSESGGRLTVAVHDTVLGETITLATDTVALSAATVPDKTMNKRLSELLKVSLSDDGFFMEAHVKLRPVDFANEGIFVCGLAHSPKTTEENITQALAAAGRAACILSKPSLEVGGVVSVVDEDKCAVCLTCVRECVYNAPFVNARGKAEIEAAKCQGCGNCAAACPAKAIQLRTFTDLQENALFHAILNEETVEV